MTTRRPRVIVLLSLLVCFSARAQIEPQRPIAHGTLGIYQTAGASWSASGAGAGSAS